MVIRFFENGAPLRELDLEGVTEEIIIGRGATGVAYKDPHVSRRHVAIQHRDGTFFLTDTGSTGGTFMDSGTRIPARQAIALEAGMIFYFSTPGNKAVVEMKVERPGALPEKEASPKPEAIALKADRPPPPPPPPKERSTAMATKIGSMDPGQAAAAASGKTAPMAALLQAKDQISIGRSSDNDVVLPDLLVSRHHAQVRRAGQDYFIKDLGSSNGTFVNGRKISSETRITPTDLILVGATRLSLHASPQDIRHEAAIRMIGLAKMFPGNKQGFAPVTLRLPAQSVTGIMGPSGCGKSTLLNVLTGNLAATGGTVLIHGLELRQNIHYLKHHVGYVPQYDIVHKALTVRDALRYTAKLRIEGISDKDIREKSDRILNQLRIADLADQRIGSLSGGQRKRVSIALEMINDPLILFLDEPTSPLDPQSAQELMEILRGLADKGNTTVIMVTHKPDDVRYLDQVLFLGKKGYPMYYGKPGPHLDWFNVDSTVSVYAILNEPESQNFADLYRRYEGVHGAEEAGADDGQSRMLSRKVFSPSSQLKWLVHRLLRIKLNDVGSTALLLLQAPIIAILICIIFPDITISVLFLLAVSAIWLGVNNAGREIVDEADIYRRERMYNLGIGPYLASKVIVFTLFGIIQSALFTLIITMRYANTDVPVESPIGMFFIMAMLNLVACLMGLFVSATARNSEQVMSVIPLLLIPQILLAGIITKVQNILVEIISYFTLSRWGTEAFTNAQPKAMAEVPQPGNGGGMAAQNMAVDAQQMLLKQYVPAYADHNIFGPLTATYFLELFMILLLGAAMIYGTVRSLKKKDIT